VTSDCFIRRSPCRKRRSAESVLYDDLFDMAAAYLYHIVQNHPFVDGNKRTGAAAAIIFLAMNGIEIEADEDGLVEMTMAVAQSRVGKREIAAFFRQRSQ
jgi:death-on-curing protein